METTENQLIIGKFHGIECKIINNVAARLISRNGKTERWEALEYHKDWNLLMPVIEKVEGLSKNPPIELLVWARNNNTIFDLKLTETTINEAYKAVIEFIKWYNENK